MQTGHYSALGLSNDATLEEVHAAHKKLLRQFVQRHKAGQPVSREDFDALENAYATLGDPEKKAEYDRALYGEPPLKTFPDTEAAASVPEETPVHHTLEFTGSGGEYFRIWIVNLALTILTLGIYSAWAKVRREQYFHRNTLLDGSSFDYHGNPIAILKGRLIATGLWIALSIIEYFFPQFYLIALFIVSPAIPWLVVRSFRFRARNTSYRGLRFDFHAGYTDFFRAFWPYILLVLAIVLFQTRMFPSEKIAAAQIKRDISYLLCTLIFPVLAYALAAPAFIRAFKRFQINNLSFGDSRFDCAPALKAFYLIGFRTFLIVAAVICVISFSFTLIFATLITMPFIMLVLFLAPWIYFQVRVTNLVWNSTALGRHRFTSNQTFKELFWIAVSNWLLTLLTLGLYWPWWKVRLAVYRARHTTLIASGGLDNFIGEAIKDQNAIGEETTDFFDFDIAL
ncbi:MAG: DUF898 family protein [Candidatus Accumulibacter sp.]|jgi:uncharacterized membrane protein YjgN (DUF898 family)|nr:DUF898 family protein [Accumulibacter sp.]